MSWQEIAYISYAAMNVVTMFAYAIDKGLSVVKWRRISERTLLTMTIFGGIGALWGMLLCRHKIRKPRFWGFVALSLALHGGLYYLYSRYLL